MKRACFCRMVRGRANQRNAEEATGNAIKDGSGSDLVLVA
jgi:hypothetical protein